MRIFRVEHQKEKNIEIDMEGFCEYLDGEIANIKLTQAKILEMLTRWEDTFKVRSYAAKETVSPNTDGVHYSRVSSALYTLLGGGASVKARPHIPSTGIIEK